MRAVFLLRRALGVLGLVAGTGLVFIGLVPASEASTPDPAEYLPNEPCTSLGFDDGVKVDIGGWGADDMPIADQSFTVGDAGVTEYGDAQGITVHLADFAVNGVMSVGVTTTVPVEAVFVKSAGGPSSGELYLYAPATSAPGIVASLNTSIGHLSLCWNGGAGTSDDGTSDDGTSDDGTSDDGTSDDGTSDDGTSDDGTSDDGTSDDGTSDDGTSDDGTSDDGTSDDGTSDDGTSDDGTSDDGTSDDVLGTTGEADGGTSDDGTTDDLVLGEVITRPTPAAGSGPAVAGSGAERGAPRTLPRTGDDTSLRLAGAGLLLLLAGGALTGAGRRVRPAGEGCDA